MSYQKDRDEFIGVIVGEVRAQWPVTGRRPGDKDHEGVALARLLLRNASTMQRLAETACNRELTPGEQKQDAACQARIEAACKPWGIVPNFNGDPRGAVVKVSLPSGRSNSFGGPECGYCVPTR